MKFPKPKAERDEAYKEWIKSLCCCITGGQDYDVNTGRRYVDPHHVPQDGHGGKGTKTSDYRCIPLINRLHREAHRIGKHSFATKYGLDYEHLIAALNQKWEELHGNH